MEAKTEQDDPPGSTEEPKPKFTLKQKIALACAGCQMKIKMKIYAWKMKRMEKKQNKVPTEETSDTAPPKKARCCGGKKHSKEPSDGQGMLKKHGFEKPWHPLQMVSWVAFRYDICTQYRLCYVHDVVTCVSALHIIHHNIPITTVYFGLSSTLFLLPPFRLQAGLQSLLFTTYWLSSWYFLPSQQQVSYLDLIQAYWIHVITRVCISNSTRNGSCRSKLPTRGSPSLEW